MRVFVWSRSAAASSPYSPIPNKVKYLYSARTELILSLTYIYSLFLYHLRNSKRPGVAFQCRL